MLEKPSWQGALIRDLLALLEPDEDVRALILGGSCARSESGPDVWSDVDVLLVVGEHAVSRFFPTNGWLQSLGEIYASDRNSGELTHTTRVCFKDFRRLDVVLTTEAALEQVDSWGSFSFGEGARTLFSRSPVVEKVFSRTFERRPPPLMSLEQFQELANHFWFKAALAVTKVVRGDLLIALHLSLDLVRDCCVLGMLLRDRAEGTNYHRHGGIGNDFVERLRVTEHTYDAAGILYSIEQGGIAFDGFASQWSSAYVENRHPLLAAINRARLDVLET